MPSIFVDSSGQPQTAQRFTSRWASPEAAGLSIFISPQLMCAIKLVPRYTVWIRASCFFDMFLGFSPRLRANLGNFFLAHSVLYGDAKPAQIRELLKILSCRWSAFGHTSKELGRAAQNFLIFGHVKTPLA
jgi:hypothetical protein